MPRSAPSASVLEQRFAYRIREYLAGGRTQDAEFSLPGLRSWMLCQQWPDPPESLLLECLAVLGWSAICQIEDRPADESAIRQELGRQLDYLEGHTTDRPPSLDHELSMTNRVHTYANLRHAAEPGSDRREHWGLPKFNVTDRTQS